MKESYVTPALELVSFAAEDVIRTSGGGNEPSDVDQSQTWLP